MKRQTVGYRGVTPEESSIFHVGGPATAKLVLWYPFLSCRIAFLGQLVRIYVEVPKTICPLGRHHEGRGLENPVKVFPTSNLVTIQNLVTVCQTGCTYVGVTAKCPPPRLVIFPPLWLMAKRECLDHLPQNINDAIVPHRIIAAVHNHKPAIRNDICIVMIMIMIKTL